MAAHSHGAPLGAAYPADWGAGPYQGVDRLTDTWLAKGRKIVLEPKPSQIIQSTYARYLETRAALHVCDFP
jgi:hypothetical protein